MNRGVNHVDGQFETDRTSGDVAGSVGHGARESVYAPSAVEDELESWTLNDREGI